MPEGSIHIKSLRMPSLVMFPCIQCHHTRGFAELGGVVKPAYKLSFSAGCFGWAHAAADNNSAAERGINFFIVIMLLVEMYSTLSSLSISLGKPKALARELK